MQTKILDWLVADYSVFGLHIQHWMPVVALTFAIFIVFSWLDHRKARKPAASVDGFFFKKNRAD
jgi:hypothetical protein